MTTLKHNRPPAQSLCRILVTALAIVIVSIHYYAILAAALFVALALMLVRGGDPFREFDFLLRVVAHVHLFTSSYQLTHALFRSVP